MGSRPAYAAAGRPVKTAGNQPITTRLLSENDVYLQNEETSVSVIPKGTDVSRSVTYGSAAHVTGTAVRQDPAFAWAAMGLAGGGCAGYQADGTAKGMAAGAAAGTAVTLISGLIGVAVSRSRQR